MASDHVDAGKVTAQSAAIQINGWKYIWSAMKGSNDPFANKKLRTIRSNP